MKKVDVIKKKIIRVLFIVSTAVFMLAGCVGGGGGGSGIAGSSHSSGADVPSGRWGGNTPGSSSGSGIGSSYITSLPDLNWTSIDLYLTVNGVTYTYNDFTRLPSDVINEHIENNSSTVSGTAVIHLADGSSRTAYAPEVITSDFTSLSFSVPYFYSLVNNETGSLSTIVSNQMYYSSSGIDLTSYNSTTLPSLFSLNKWIDQDGNLYDAETVLTGLTGDKTLTTVWGLSASSTCSTLYRYGTAAEKSVSINVSGTSNPLSFEILPSNCTYADITTSGSSATVTVLENAVIPTGSMVIVRATDTVSGSEVEVVLSITDRLTITTDGIVSGTAGLSGNITVPSVINGITVTGLANNAFIGNEDITGVTLPSGLTSVGNEAFSGCTNITGISLPDTITSIGNSAFSGCGFTGSVTLPENLTSLGAGAFEMCANLGPMVIPEGVTEIKENTFYCCQHNMTSITISSNTTKIGENAFRDCALLSSINPKLPSTLTYLGENVFWGCNGLVSVTYDGTQSELLNLKPAGGWGKSIDFTVNTTGGGTSVYVYSQ